MDVHVPMTVHNFHVFLSFRGPDARKSFAHYFYNRLGESGIKAFIDRKEIKYGERINDKIVAAIKHSNICIPIFSKDFASSPACLMEVAQMVKSDKKILPIFFRVKPCDVRHQLGTYEKSFCKHERKNRYPKSTEDWRAALTKIGGIMGPELKELYSECQELEDFISELWKLLGMDEIAVTKPLVGIDRDVPKMMQKLGFHYQDGQIVKEGEMTVTGRWVLVVYGLPGVGKTTLATVVYEKIRHLFDSCSFLQNVQDMIKPEEVVTLQKKLICDLNRGDCAKVESFNQGTRLIQHRFKKNRVLIVLDDVDDLQQIKPLAEQLTWFGPGSTIILTTRRKGVMEDYKRVQNEKEHELPKENEPKFFQEHNVSCMNQNDALQLFCNYAFGLNHPREGYHPKSRKIISAVGFLPFAVKFVGKYLHEEPDEVWTETLDSLKRGLEKENVKPMLMRCYERLGGNAKEIFLDIACFFTGVETRIPFYMWAACKYEPHRSVGYLKKRFLLKIGEKNKFWMHRQLKFLGREIVKDESLDNPGERSRLWDYEAVRTILEENKGAEKVKALRVTPNFKKVDDEVFHRLSNLRFLELGKVDIEGKQKNLLPKLVWLDWSGCAQKSKLFAFKMKELVILNLCSSPVPLESQDWNRLMKNAPSLKVLNLKGCEWIKASLKFPGQRNLERLILEGCLLSMATMNESDSSFKKLVSLNMKHCEHIKCLPQALCSMKTLKELLVDGTDIERLHFEEGSLQALEILSACKCKALGEVTNSIGLLKSLRKLTLENCENLEELPADIGELVLLQEMDLSYTLIKELPPSVKKLENLEVLKMARTFLKGFPEATKYLKELKELDFTNCGSLSGDCEITGLDSLRILRLKGTKISQVLPRDKVHRLHILELDNDVAD